jgi:hypothetical protein
MYLIFARLTDEQIAFRVGIVAGALLVAAFAFWFHVLRKPKE